MLTFKTVSVTSILLVLVLSLAGSSGISIAAEPIKPPFEDALKQRYAIVLAKQAEADTSTSKFNILRTLWDPKKQAHVNSDVTVSNFSHIYENIQEKNKHQSSCYILIISKFQKHRFFRDEIVDNPNGMSIQTLPAVGPGIFDCSDPITRLWNNVINDDQQPAKPVMLHDLMTLAESPDLQSRRIAAFELSLHGDWMAEANEKNVTHLRRLMNQSSITAEANEMLIQSAKGLPEPLYQDWFRSYLLSVLQNNPSPYDLGSFTPLLVRNSILTLKDLSLNQKSDWDLLMPFLYSNAPGVSKAAISALDAIDASRFKKDSIALLADSNKVERLHTETKRALEAHLRQTATL